MSQTGELDQQTQAKHERALCAAKALDAPVERKNSWQSPNFPGRPIRHRNFLGELNRPGKGESPNDVLFRIVNGPDGHPRLESTNPGYFLEAQELSDRVGKGGKT